MPTDPRTGIKVICQDAWMMPDPDALWVFFPSRLTPEQRHAILNAWIEKMNERKAASRGGKADAD